MDKEKLPLHNQHGEISHLLPHELLSNFNAYIMREKPSSEKVLQEMANVLQKQGLVYEEIFSKIIARIEDKEYLRTLLDKFSDFDLAKHDPNKYDPEEEPLYGTVELSGRREIILPYLRTAQKYQLLPEGKTFGDYAHPNRPFDSPACHIIQKLDAPDKIGVVFTPTHRLQTRLFALSLLEQPIDYPANPKADQMILDLFIDDHQHRRPYDKQEDYLRLKIIQKGLLDKVPDVLFDIIKKIHNILMKNKIWEYCQKFRTKEKLK